MAKDISSCPALPSSHHSPAMRMPSPPESSNHPVAATATTATFNQSWAYSNPSQSSPVSPSHGFSTIHNHRLPQLPPNDPYRGTMLPSDHHHHLPPSLGNYRVNSTVAGAPSHPLHHDTPRHSAPLESTNVELSAHLVPHPQYHTPVPAPTIQTPAFSDHCYQSQAHGMRRGKAPRAQQVR